MTEQTIPEPLAAYFAQREAGRANAVATVWGSLTEREQGLVHDAAVMGYVQGMRHPAGERIGKDRQTIALVLDACLAFPDLYPTVAAVREQAATQPATERAAVLREAADFVRDAHFRDGLTVQEIGTALRHMADGATS